MAGDDGPEKESRNEEEKTVESTIRIRGIGLYLTGAVGGFTPKETNDLRKNIRLVEKISN